MPAGIRLVVDTNIIVAALLSLTRSRSSLEREIFEWISSADPVRPLLLVSDEILEEYHEVLGRPKFKEFRSDPQRIRVLLAGLVKMAIRMDPVTRVKLDRDASDEKFLECAIEGHAKYLITNNKKDYPDWAMIVDAREFLNLDRPH